MITYGEGDLLLSSNEKKIEIKYDGVFTIVKRSNGVIIDGNRNKLSIYMQGNKPLPELLFKYKGFFKIDSVIGFEDTQSYIISVTVLGLDLWKLDTGIWEEDTSAWGSVTNNYKVGFPQKYRPEQFDNIIRPQVNKGFTLSTKTSSNKIKGIY